MDLTEVNAPERGAPTGLARSVDRLALDHSFPRLPSQCNYMAEEAIRSATEQRDFSVIERLRRLLAAPFDEQPAMDHYAGLPPDWADQLSVSCSS